MMNYKKLILLFLGILFLLAIVITVLIWQTNERHRSQIYESMQISFREDPVIEYGDSIDINDLILSKEGGTIKEIPTIDTMTIGEQTLSFTMENEGVERTFDYTVTIQDTTPPLITLKSDTVTLDENESFDPSSNIQSVKDPIDGELSLQEELDEHAGYIITGEVDTSSPGTYTLTVKAVDQHNNQAEASFQVEVKARSVAPSTDDTETSPTYINQILIVNKQYALPADYGNGLDTTAYNAFLQLQADASKAGHSIPLVSGYRSYSYQASLYDSYVARDGQAAADRYSARPGHSEHQSGLAMDVGAIDDNYGNTAAGKWLVAHCAEYGFILRYPQGKEAITGYMYEPWHIRYVGVDVAKKIMDANITLEEYLGLA